MQYLTPDWPLSTHIHAYSTTKALDLKDLKQVLHLPEDPFWPKQVHGTTVLNIDTLNESKEGDAVISFNKERVCIVKTGDCLPILVCNQEETVIGAIHAGWRSLLAGIIEETIAAMKVPPETLWIWLGPAIGPQKFEVGLDVRDPFVAKDKRAAEAFIPFKTEGKFLGDLYLLAKQRLENSGVPPSHVYGGGFCTYSESKRFYSYRRDGKAAGNRMATLIWRK